MGIQGCVFNENKALPKDTFIICPLIIPLRRPLNLPFKTWHERGGVGGRFPTAAASTLVSQCPRFSSAWLEVNAAIFFNFKRSRTFEGEIFAPQKKPGKDAWKRFQQNLPNRGDESHGTICKQSPQTNPRNPWIFSRSWQ